jgi:hypothetical protein
VVVEVLLVLGFAVAAVAFGALASALFGAADRLFGGQVGLALDALGVQAVGAHSHGVEAARRSGLV